MHSIICFIAYFIGGALLTNAIPHFVSGVMGRRFQSPFATPPGKGLSTSRVNVLWGFFNLVIGDQLISQVGMFDACRIGSVLPVFLGILVMGLLLAQIFGPLHGGDRPERG